MNIYGLATSAAPSYLTPRVTFGTPTVAESPTQAYQANTDADYTQENWALHAAKLALTAPVDVADSLAALAPGMQRGELDDKVYDSIGLPGVAQFVRQNKQGVELASGALGAVVVGAAAEIGGAKLVGSAWFAATGLGRVAAPLINMVSNAERAAQAETTIYAAAGDTLSWYQGANRALVLARAGEGLAKAATSEIAIAAALNKNTAVWSDDMHTNMLFAGLGLGLGGVLGGIAGRGMVSKWANSDAVRDTFAEAADPGSYERQLTEAPLSGQITNRSVPKPSSVFTDMMLNARRDDAVPSRVSGSTTPNQTRNAIQIHTTDEANSILQMITSKGNKLVPDSKFGITSSAGQQLKQAAHDDPTILYGASDTGVIPEGSNLNTVLTKRQAAVQGLATSKKPADQQLAARLSIQQPLVLIHGSWMTTQDAEPFLSFTPNTTEIKQTKPGINELQVKSNTTGKTMILQQDGSFNGSWMALPIQDQLHLIDGMNAMITKLIKTATPMVLPAKPLFHQIDMAIQMAKMGGKVDVTRLAGFQTLEAAAQDSLRQKAAIAKGMQDLTPQMRFKLNLPLQTSSERISDPTGATLRSVITQAGSGNMSMMDLQDLRVQQQRTFNLTQDIKGDGTLDGNMFGFNRTTDQKNTWMQPVLSFFDDTQAAKWSHWELGDQIAENNTARTTVMARSRSGKFVASLTQGIMADPSVKGILQMSGLADSQIGGTAGMIGSAASQTLSQGFRFRNTPVLAAAQALRRVVNRFTEATVDTALKNVSPHVTGLSSITGADSKILMQQYMSHAGGWDIARAIPHPTDPTMIAFELRRDSTSNAQRLGRAVQKGELLNAPNGKPIVLDGQANAARMAFEQEYTTLLKNRNVVRQARGLEPIRLKPFFTPPPNTSGKLIGFTLDANNRVVPGGAVVASTQAEFDAARQNVLNQLHPGQRFMTKAEIEAHMDLWDQAQLDFIDPTSMAGPSGTSRGGLTGAVINPHALEDSLAYIKNGYEQIANGTMRTLFDPQLRVARIRAAAEANSKGIVAGGKSIWQTFDETLMGRPGSVNPKGIAPVFQEVDKAMDKAIAAAWPVVTIPGRHLRDLANKIGLHSLTNVKSFNDIATQLGPHMPFADAQQYAEYTYGITPPWKSKAIAGQLNRFAASVVLRWLEIPNAAMNMTGIITNMPGLLSQKNVPLIGQVGSKIGVVDSAKIMSRGFKRMLSEHSGADWDMMVRNGDTTQDVSEMNQQLALVKGRSSWQKVFLGDPGTKELPATAPLGDKTRNMLQRKGVEGMVSIMQDTSESLSRRWAHFVGLELADLHGITGLESRHQFARQIANDAIANYDPLNRPEIYQSAFGSLYGLFMSYSQNYYQRMFRWMEDGDYAALGKSLATQSAMFGMAGVPGFQQISDLLGGEDTNTGLLDNLYKRLGPATASVVAHGGFNQLTTLLGLPAMALSSRGDMNFRSPAVDFATSGGVFQLPIGLKVIHDMTSGVFDIVGRMVNKSSPLTAQYAAETLARQMPNRAIHGALTVLAAGGTDADVNGNVMAETQNWAESIYRVLGFRSQRQQAEIDAYFMNQKALQIDAQRLDKVRVATRAAIRGGNMDSLPEIFDDYVKAGGKPWNYPSWIQGMIKEANDTRTQNQLLKTMRSPGMQGLANRIQLFTQPY